MTDSKEGNRPCLSHESVSTLEPSTITNQGATVGILPRIESDYGMGMVGAAKY